MRQITDDLISTVVAILVDAKTGYTYRQIAQVLEALAKCPVIEPSPAQAVAPPGSQERAPEAE